ncbi:hypothetical protein BUALT_Bualt17G0021700 [Buddleja alternifolia]|uniref:Spt6 SH2 domain-containing protein n=1 Tax=Buddleja alternifolia TaxID=168488 RepID=A0AAV6W667_9LAMI|nr:hypothetical protein BUALT_Bualt17G0021700 [Buddleja alternifolia]
MKAICVLESGLTGILSEQDYTDDWTDINELTDKLHEGDILSCRIKSIQKNCYQVFLTCSESDMRSNHFENNQDMDLAKTHFKPKMIVHPRFQTITADKAIEVVFHVNSSFIVCLQFLLDKDPGESVIHPSSRGPSFFTLVLKVYDGVYANKDIIEGGKDHKGIKTLKIDKDTFEDIDEVMF